MGRCLTIDEMAALADGSLPPSQSRRLIGHCADCPACQSQLEEWRANRVYAGDIRRAVHSASTGSSELAVAGGFKLTSRIVPLMSHDTIRGYEILGEIHRGGQGVVYRAIQKSTRREVAIKVAFDEVRLTGKRPHRFDREIELASLLKHPSIIAIFDSGTTADGRCYFVMDYVHGLPLDQYVREHELSVEQALNLFICVCRAVNHAHQRGVIHRDLKPSNILVDVEGVPRVLDFGLAKILGAGNERLGSMVSAAGQMLGTVPYMAPEQLAGRPETADVRTDVYALGVVLYEMLAGCLPYDISLPASQILRRITEGSAPPPSRQWTSVKGIGPHASRKSRRGACPIDDELDAIALRALAHDPDRRYQSTADLARELGCYLAGEPVEAKRDGGFYVMRKLLYRHRLPVGIAGAFLVLLALALAVISTLYVDVNRLNQVSEEQRRVAQAERDRAVQARRYADNHAEQLRAAMYLNHMTAAMGASVAGNFPKVREEIYACPADLRGWEWYRLASQFDHSSRVLRGHQQSVAALGMDSAGIRLLSGGRDSAVIAWDLRQGDQISQVPVLTAVREMCFSPDGRRCAVWSADRTVTIWDTDGTQVAQVQHQGSVRCMCFNPDSSLLAIGNSSGWVEICDAFSGVLLRRVGPHEACAFTVAFSPDGSRIATGSWDETIRIWNVQDGTELHVLQTPHDTIPTIAWSPDGTRLVSGGGTGSLIVWDVLRGKREKRLREKGSYVCSAAFAPDSRLLATAEENGIVSFWDLQTGAACGGITVEGVNMRSLMFTPDGQWLVGAADDNSIRMWESSRLPYSIDIAAHEGPSRAVAFGSGGLLASAGDDRTVKIWDVSSGRLLHTLAGHQEKVRSVAFGPDSSWLVSGSMDKTVRIWDTRTGQERNTLRGHEDCVLDVAVSPDGRLIASGGSDYLTKVEDNSVRIWDSSTGEERLCLRGHRGGVPAVTFSPDGTRVASGSRDKTVIVWDLATGRSISVFKGHDATVRRVRFSPDGKSVISLGEDDTVQTWDGQTGKLVAPPLAHPKSLLDMALTPDGSRMATCGKWGHVRIWKHDIGWELLRLPCPLATIWSLDFSPDGTCLAASGENGSVWVWRAISPQDLQSSPHAAEGLAAGAMHLWSLRQAKDAEMVFKEAMGMHQTIFGAKDRRTLELARRYEQFRHDDFSEAPPARNTGSGGPSTLQSSIRPEDISLVGVEMSDPVPLVRQQMPKMREQ